MPKKTKRLAFRSALSAAVRLVKLIEDQEDDPMNEYCPSECVGAISAGVEQQVRRFQRKVGWSIAELLGEAETRTSAGWSHHSGLDSLVIQ